MVKFKMNCNGRDYDGVWTAEECGENVKAYLNATNIFNPAVYFTKVEDDGSPYKFGASAKKSQSKPVTFSQMVAKQRSKNKSIKKHDLYSDEALEDFYNDQDFYINAYNKIRAKTDELLSALDKVISAEEPDEYFNGDDGKQLDLKATAVRDIAQEIIDRVWGNS